METRSSGSHSLSDWAHSTGIGPDERSSPVRGHASQLRVGHVIRDDGLVQPSLSFAEIVGPLPVRFVVLALSGPHSTRHAAAVFRTRLVVTLSVEVRMRLFGHHRFAACQLSDMRKKHVAGSSTEWKKISWT